MTDPTPIRGNLEILTGTEPNVESIGVPVMAITPDLVPTLLAALYGLTEITATDDGWIATGDWLQPVRIILHREPPFDETLIGKAIAAAIAQDGGTP